MPRLSIIIPVLDSAERLESTLVSVLENRPADCEIIVALRSAYADPYDLAGEVRFLSLRGDIGLISAVNEAVACSQAPVVHILAAGMEVTDGWTEAALTQFHDHRVATVAPLIVDALDMQTPIAAGLAYSPVRGRVVLSGRTLLDECSPNSGQRPADALGPLVQAAFYRRSALELAGGLPENVGDSFADADLALSLRFAGYRSVFEPRCVIRGAAADVAPLAQSFRQGLAAERLFWRAAPSAGWLRSILAHPLGVLAQFIQALPRPAAMTSLLGRLVALCQMRSHRAHHQWLLDLRRTANALFNGTRPQRIRMDAAHGVSSPRPGREAQIATHSP